MSSPQTTVRTSTMMRRANLIWRREKWSWRVALRNRVRKRMTRMMELLISTMGQLHRKNKLRACHPPLPQNIPRTTSCQKQSNKKETKPAEYLLISWRRARGRSWRGRGRGWRALLKSLTRKMATRRTMTRQIRLKRRRIGSLGRQ